MAPEQTVDDGVLGPWTDLYALGTVVWDLLTGEPPHVAESTAATMERIRIGRLPAFRPKVAVPDGVEARPTARGRWSGRGSACRAPG
jgi:hypothetical protein